MERLSFVAQLPLNDQYKYMIKLGIIGLNPTEALTLQTNIEAIHECDFKNMIKRGLKIHI